MAPPLTRPTRLLDLGAEGCSPVTRLVNESGTDGAPYATFSYRWGPRLPLMLLPSNVESFESGIRYATLPQTFKDAISVCRELSIRYLWIDALCIVQGPFGDFKAEA
ncbi:hypothetical protein B0J12DRAFT_651125 [Macrophomina phaseolina]|uniref:Heterokaryon incompatibility domain-containing protein n=1 Tax=Macrophomina phaseolina TaxID=35725 RepID=A0ABQ8GJU2_9PEZI|nr:hypothetical protein B0J12DRAFT_651125 [Macrophomina phaseolina]